ncbi:MAG TPA: hypothetical protein PLR25_22465 [Planctomycetaceae bacterium]|nr:hypothetical protein [Planctomycetaceae bacterium]
MRRFGFEIASGVAMAIALWGMANLPLSETVVTQATSQGTTENSSSAAAATTNGSQANPRVSWIPTSEFSRQAEDEAEQRLNRMMQETRVGLMNYPGDTPLSEILDQLGTHISLSLGQAIQFRPDVSALDEESISSLQNVLIKDIDIPADMMTAGSALDYILSQTDPRLAWIARNELLLITTETYAEAEENLLLRSYDISKLCNVARRGSGVRNNSGGQGGEFYQILDSGGAVPSAQQSRQTPLFDSPQSLMQAVVDLTSPPCRWFEIDGEGGRIVVAGNRMLIRQARTGHRLIGRIIAELETAAAGN